VTVADVEDRIGVPGFLDGLRARLKTGTFRPLPVRERKVPKPGGSDKIRKLGISPIADRVYARKAAVDRGCGEASPGDAAGIAAPAHADQTSQL
jgi:hypothetical protein